MYNLENTIRNKIFNYKQTVNQFDVHDQLTYGTGLSSCECHRSPFLDEHHGHIVTGDLRIIENRDLRRLLSKGPNFREPRSINWNKCSEYISSGLNACASNMGHGSDGIDLTLWINKVMQMVDSKIEILKRKIIARKTNPILKRESVQTYL